MPKTYRSFVFSEAMHPYVLWLIGVRPGIPFLGSHPQKYQSGFSA